MGKINSKVLGRMGESLAADYVRRKGYRILCRNYKATYGELDLIAAKGDCLIFIEVKTRTGDSHSEPFEAVDRRKQRKLTRLVDGYLAYAGIDDITSAFKDVRIDVISIVMSESGSISKLEHIMDAFDYDC